MPIYQYQNPKTGEIKEVIQTMKEKHEYHENGVQWNRIFTVPTTSIDTKVDPYSAKDFLKKTENKKGTLGDMMDYSKELSEKRASQEGVDSVKQKYFDRYAESRKGKRHPTEIKENLKRDLASKGVSFDD